MRPSEPCHGCGEDLATVTSTHDAATGLRVLHCPRCGRVSATDRTRRARRLRQRGPALALAALAAQLIVVSGLLALHVWGGYGLLQLVRHPPPSDAPVGVAAIAGLAIVAVALPTGAWIGAAFRRSPWTAASIWLAAAVAGAFTVAALQRVREAMDFADPTARITRLDRLQDVLLPPLATVPFALAVFVFIPVGFGLHSLVRYATRGLARRLRSRIPS